MAEPRCRRCQKRPVWRYRNNDIHACKRCYHVVWNDTRRRLRDDHAALGALERGRIPASLAGYGTDAHEIASALVKEIRDTSWRTGARHEVPLLITRCERLAERELSQRCPRRRGTAVRGYDTMGTLKRLIVALLVTDIGGWRWKGPLKCVLWVSLVMGVVGWSLVRLDRSAQELYVRGALVR